MKIFLVDKYNNNYDLVKKLNEKGFDSIEIKTDCKMRTTKSDLIILIDNGEYDGLTKNSGIVLVTRNKDSRFIWNFIHTYNCVDVIDDNLDREYIATRITNIL